jgi:hypothetical protein
MLEAVHESVQASLKESHFIKKELEDKHTQAMAELKKKIKYCDDKVQALQLNWRLPRGRQRLLTRLWSVRTVVDLISSLHIFSELTSRN